jgi:hypothetical protein
MVVLLAATVPAAGQTDAPRAPEPIRLGDSCTRRSDSHPGVVKIDGCGRFYCGRRGIKSLYDVRPNLDQDVGCTWTLEAGTCRCRLNRR